MFQRPASFWEENRTLGSYDILIVGAGMVGLWTAWHLQQLAKGLKIGVVDQLPSGQAGASTRNAGFACFGSPTELLDDLHHEHRSDIVERLSWRYQGLQSWRETFGEDALGWVPGRGFEVFSCDQSEAWQKVQSHLDSLNQLAAESGIPGEVYQKSVPPIPSLLGCISIEHEAGLHAGKAHQTIRTAVVDEGAHFLQGIEILPKTSWTKEALGWSIPTAQGVLKAHRIILATNAWSAHILDRKDILPGRGQVLLTDPIDQLPYVGTYHADEGYLYFRNVGNRLLLGGGRNAFRPLEETLSGETTANVQAYLENYLHEVLLPGFAVNVSDRWAGTMAFSNTGSKMPLLESKDGITLIARMGGMGVALSPEAGRKAAQLALGI